MAEKLADTHKFVSFLLKHGLTIENGTDLIFLNAQNYLFVNNPNYLKNGVLGDSENDLDQFFHAILI